MSKFVEKPYTGALNRWGLDLDTFEPPTETMNNAWGVSQWVFCKAVGKVPRARKRFRTHGYSFSDHDKYYLSFYLTYSRKSDESFLSCFMKPF